MLNKNSERLTCLHSAMDLESFASFFYYNGVTTAEGTGFWTPEANKDSVRVHFALGKIAITLELLGQFIRFLDKNDRHSLGVLLIY